jgi:uncharacterized protein involved in exopolysaccharide biosynthesis
MDAVNALLDQMRQQEQTLEQEQSRINEQLIATRGAVQVLEHLLAQMDQARDEGEHARD